MAAQPPGPRSLSPLGVAPQFARDPSGLVTRAIRDYGDCVLLPGPFGQNAYLLNDPDLIRAVLVTHADKIQKPVPLKRIFRSSFGNGLFFSEGAFWRRQRRLAQPAFHTQRIQAYAEGMVEHAQQTLARWHDGGVYDMEGEMRALTLEIVVDAILHSTVADETDEIRAAMSELGQTTTQQSLNTALALLPDWAPLPLMRRKRRASATLDAIIYRIIRERRPAAADHGDLLSMFMLVEDEDGQTMSDQQLRDEVMTIFIAGHETTATTLTWALVQVAQHPSIYAQLRAELARVLAGRRPSLSDLPNLTYTESIIKETLRLYPPLWLILRQAEVGFPLGRYHVPRGSGIWISPYTLHRHPGFYEAPDVFSPERFIPDSAGQDLEQRLPKLAYLPFGGGPRVCLGNAFALMEGCLVLAAILQRYEPFLLPDFPIQMRFAATLGFEKGATMRVVKHP